MPQISREFMLSFDDGPLPEQTIKIIKILKGFKVKGQPVKAGFFMVGDSPKNLLTRKRYYAPYEIWPDKGSVKKYPEAAREVVKAGHLIGNHTQHHAWFRYPWLCRVKFIEKEIFEAEKEIAKALKPLRKVPLKIFRPPYMRASRNIRKAAANLGFQIILGESAWGFKTPSVRIIKSRLLKKLKKWRKKEPCVLCFHDNQWATCRYLEEIIKELQEQGFILVHFNPSRLLNGKR